MYTIDLSALVVASAVGAHLLPVGMDVIGLGPTMLVGAGIAAIGTAMCIAWAPETKGQALHESAADSPKSTVDTTAKFQ
jgi:MFS transporter, putative metabolite transport protein